MFMVAPSGSPICRGSDERKGRMSADVEAGTQRVLRPRDADDLAQIIADGGHALEPTGLGSKRTIGRPVQADRLDLRALNGIIDYEPAELMLTLRPATPLVEVEQLLARHGQRLAFEPPDFGRLLGHERPQSIGGVLAGNLSGSRRMVAGAARDHFLGLRAVNGHAEQFTAGGRVVKNVTGYDLPKLLAGSWGTLAVFTEVTVRTAPRVQAELTLQLPVGGAHDGAELMRLALASDCEVSAASLRPDEGVALRLEGGAASIRHRADALLRELARPAVAELEDGVSLRFWRATGAAEPLADWPVVWRLSVPPAAAAATITALAPDQWLADWGGGLIWAAYRDVDEARVRGALRDGGHAMLFKAGDEVRRQVAVFPPLSAVAARFSARLREAFDPEGKLNPGRMG